MRRKLACAKNWRARRVTVCLESEKCCSDPTESEMENDGSRIPKLRKIDANAGARKGTSALNTVLQVLRIADLFMVSIVWYHTIPYHTMANMSLDGIVLDHTMSLQRDSPNS